jgi:PHS family inorganic phosphate transporter-like MFS transporter
MLGYLYGHAPGPSLNAAENLGVKVATPVGTFVGQLLFGWLADVVGRKKMCMYFTWSPYSSSLK